MSLDVINFSDNSIHKRNNKKKTTDISKTIS